MPSDIASTPKLAHLVSLRNLGGVERYFSRFYTGYGQHLDLDILLQTNDIHPFIRPSLVDAKPRIHSIKGPGNWKFPEIMGLREAYQRTLVRRLDPDAIVVWNKLAGNPIPLLTGRPVFHYEHGTSWTAQDPASVASYLQHVQGVIAVSRAAERMLQIRWNVSLEVPSIVLHNAIELPSRQSEHPDGRFRLGFAGRLKGLKAPMVALETFRSVQARVPHAELWIAGQGPLEPTLREWTKRWKLEKYVKFCGLVDDMSEFYTQLDAFICPSWREPFGLVAQEAIAYGLPTVVNNVDGLPEAIIDESCGAVVEPRRPREALRCYGEACIEGPEEVYSPSRDDLVSANVIDPEEAATHLVAWANSAELRREIGHRAREKLASQQNLQRYGDQLMAFIRRHL
jgi:glycosyltransferase involved in cell wall biosynthesis